MKSLKYIRIFLAIIFIFAITFLFVGVGTGLGLSELDFFARIQLVPAFLALNILCIVILVVITLLFGRIYCSVICPLGVLQDFVARIKKWTVGKKRRKVGVYKYSKSNTKIRLTFLPIFVIILLLGILNIMALSLGALIEPYSAFGRIVTAFISPLYDIGNNALADVTAESGSYLFIPVHRSISAVLFVIASITFLVVTVCAFRSGRLYCNTICPVGTILGYASKISLFKIRIDAQACNSCGSCSRHCKSGCIDSQNHVIDYTRCVDCFDCLNVCRRNAIRFTSAKIRQAQPAKHDETKAGQEVADSTVENTQGRRLFLASLATVTGVIVAKSAEKVTDGGLTALKTRKLPARKTRILPPGVISQARLNAHCVGCQLCIQACPNGLLSMSDQLSTFMQPVLNYNENYCPPFCQTCSNVCPTGVFQPLDEALKSSLKIGTASVNVFECISAKGEDSCGNCARHCPVGAIKMVDNGASPVPVVRESLCIGCGACEVHCPVGTIATMTEDHPAIHVEGVSTQRYI